VNEITFDVPGNPPLKGEAVSAFSAKHGQAGRIRTLLESAQRACEEQAFVPVEQGNSVALTVVARSPAGDAANIIGGIADVLEDKLSKSYRSAIDHLGDLAAVWLYRNDNQIKQIEYREEVGETGYRVTVRALVNSVASDPRANSLPGANTEVGKAFRHLGIVITLTGIGCAFMVRLKASRVLRDDSYEEVVAGDGAKFVAVRTRVLNDSMVSIDLTCGYPIVNHLIDDRGRRFDSIGKLYRIPGNPRCNDNLQPGFTAGMTWIYRVPLDAKISAYEFEDLTDFARDRTVEPTRIPLTVPAPESEMPLAGSESQSTQSQPGSSRLPAGQGPGPNETSASSRGLWEPEEWPPISFAENGHILVWWLPEYDEALRQLVDEFQWMWRSAVLSRLEMLIPETVLRAWRDADPLCQEWSWYNVLSTFAAARAKQLGIRPRQAQRVVCSCCSREFLESHLGYALVARVGVNGIDVCERCLGQALYAKGSPTSGPEAVTAVLQTLSRALQRPSKGSDLNGRLDLKGLSRDARAGVIQALRVKPTVARVKELFGSWDAAIAHAATAPVKPLPPYEPPAVAAPATDTAFTSADPARYRLAMGPLPEVTLDIGRETVAYREEIQSLIGTGYLALAEAALIKLREQDPFLSYLLAQVYGETARFGEAHAAIKHQWPDIEAPAGLIQPRDLRSITPGPIFYEPLSSPPRGNIRFVLVGGLMEYVDRRGEHRCTTGEQPEGGAAAELAESVARMNAMVDGAPWVRAATETGQAILRSLARISTGPRPHGHMICYVTSTFRDIVKSLTGALPRKVAEDAWSMVAAGKSGWSYQRDAGRYVFNANAGFTFMTVEVAPAVCIWGWPDRSDLCLQAFADTVAAEALDPITVILPDVPAFRDFARRYVRREWMEKSVRTLIEECFYRVSGDMITKRGYVLSAEFAPRLIVQPDGTEDDGTALAGALAYLDAHHTLRLSVWDVLSDALLREAATATPVAPRSFSASAADRADMVRWHAQYAEYVDTDALLRHYRPSLLDAVVSP
jgi:hypothetical protein